MRLDANARRKALCTAKNISCDITKISSDLRQSVSVSLQQKGFDRMKKSITFIENVNSAMRGFEIANRIVADDPTVHYLVMNRHSQSIDMWAGQES